MASNYCDYLLDLGSCESNKECMDVMFDMDTDFVDTSSWVPIQHDMSVCMTPKNQKVAVLCGCTGRFTWEIIPTEYSDFYTKPHLVNTVDHTMGSCKVFTSFSEALVEGYNCGILQIAHNCNDDYCLGVYQQHEDNCYRRVTRYTVLSIKKMVLYIQQLKTTPIPNAFCQCSGAVPTCISPFFVCFTCLQLHLEIQAVYLCGIPDHFSYQVLLNPDIAKNITQGEVKPKMFKAQSLFIAGLAVSQKVKDFDHVYMHKWSVEAVSRPYVQNLFYDPCFCILCSCMGNGKSSFFCQHCKTITSRK